MIPLSVPRVMNATFGIVEGMYLRLGPELAKVLIFSTTTSELILNGKIDFSSCSFVKQTSPTLNTFSWTFLVPDEAEFCVGS